MRNFVEKARAGDRLAEKELFQYLFVRFRYLAKRKVGEIECEDIAQQACMTIIEKYKTAEFTVSFQAWAYGVLKMKIGNYLQAKERLAGKRVSLSRAADLPETAGPDPDLKRTLIECLKMIAKSYRRYARVLSLTYQGYSTAEVCRKLGITANNYYVTLNRGRAMLKECLETGNI